MKKLLKKIMFVALAAMTFTACEDVPEPYDLPDNGSNVVNPGEDGTLPYVSSNLNAGWTLLAVTPDQPWSLGNSYVQATGYQKWDGAEEKSNRSVEGWLISPAVNTTDADSVKISFEQTIRYTNNVSGWVEYHKIYASANYDGTNFDAATWIPLTFTPVASPYSDWTLYPSGDIQLPQEMAGKAKVHVAFWFKAPATASTTWELKNFRMEKGQAHANVTPEEETIGTAEEPITVADALAKTNALEDGAKSSSKAYVKGKVVKVTTNQTNFEKYGNITYYISDDGSDNNSIQVYAGDGLNGEKFTSVSDIAAGDEVVVLGTLYKYVNKNSGAVVPEIEGSYLVSLVKGTPQPGGEAKGTGTLEDPFNAVAANNEAAKLSKGAVSEKSFYIKGKVAKIALDKNNNVQNFDFGGYGNASFYISDDGNDANTFYCYRVLYLENSEWAQGAGPVLKVNDEVIVCAKLTNYNGTYETQQKEGYLYSLNGKTKREGTSPQPGGDEVKTVSIAEFNAAAVSNTVWYQLTGTVQNLKDGDQYGNFDLVDETGSVYVYGLLSEKGGAKKQFQELAAAKGITNGSKLTLIGNRGDYQGKIEVVNAYFVSVEAGSGEQGGEQGGGEQGGGEVSGTGSYSEPYSIAAVIANGTSNTVQGVYVKGYIVGWVDGQVLASGANFNGQGGVKTNLLIADNASETDVAKCVPVQLPNNAVRTGLNLQDNSQYYGKEVLLYGNLEKYFGAAGVKGVTYAECDGKTIGTKP